MFYTGTCNIDIFGHIMLFSLSLSVIFQLLHLEFDVGEISEMYMEDMNLAYIAILDRNFI